MEAAVADLHDRRESTRTRSPEALGIVSARVRPGHDVVLIDLSSGGALIETSHRLLPGRLVELHVQTASQRVTIAGRVLRCAVCAVRPARMSYRGAIRFERHLRGLLDEPSGGSLVPHADPPRAVHLGSDATSVRPLTIRGEPGHGL